MKKALSVILVTIMLFSFVSISVSAFGDTMNTATDISFGTKYSGEITKSNEKDFFKIVLTESGKLTINTTVFINVYLGIYDENQKSVFNEYLSIAYTPMDLKNEVINLYLTSGTYYLDFTRAAGSSKNVGQYNITFTFESANESFKEIQGGSNEIMSKAFNVNLNEAYYGQIAKNEEKDFYKFTIRNETKIRVELNVFPYVYCTICDENGAIISDYPMLGYNHNINTLVEFNLKSGTYYLCFAKSNGTCGNYNFKISTIGHIAATAVEENYIVPTCTESGSIDKVVYCSVCGEEISRETIILDATGHADNDGDGYCDVDNEVLDPSVECDCNCHKSGISNFFFKFILFFQRLFGSNKECACGVAHY